jgi:dipeptidyl aminopeptidase/acylaminoacyl peptidase
MSTREGFDGMLAAWLDETAGRGAPDYLDETLARTVRTRQRPAWSSVARWLAVDLTAPLLSPIRSLHLRTIVVILIVAALVIGALALAVGSRRSLPPPFGPARNGLLMTSSSGDLFTVDPATAISAPFIADPANDFGPMFSRDGTRLLFLRIDDAIPSRGLRLMRANADGTEIRAITPFVDGLDWVDWSPDGTQITYLTRELGRGQINVVSADGTGLRSIDVGQPANQMSWRPPNGDEIIFRGEHMLDSDPLPAILAVHPDGSGLRPISIAPARSDQDYQDVTVSPDGSQVAYRGAPPDEGFTVHILDIASGSDRILPAPSGASQGGPLFSPDGRSVVYLRWNADNTTQLVIAPVDGRGTGTAIGPTGPVGPEGPTINNYTFSPDGTAVLANYGAEQLGRLVPVDGRPPTVIAHGDLAFASFQRLAP